MVHIIVYFGITSKPINRLSNRKYALQRIGEIGQTYDMRSRHPDFKTIKHVL